MRAAYVPSSDVSLPQGHDLSLFSHARQQHLATNFLHVLAVRCVEQETLRGPGRYQVNGSTLKSTEDNHGWDRTFDHTINQGLPTLRQKLRSEYQTEV